MKILVTGSNGYIGRHVVNDLIKDAKNEVIGVDFTNTLSVCDNFKFVNIDILNMASDENLYTLLDSPDAIIHLAWKDGFVHNSNAHLENLHKHVTFLKNMIDHGCKNISVMGTMHEIGYFEGKIDENAPCNPLSLYGIAKNALRQSLFAYAEDKEVYVKWLRAYYIVGDDAKNNSIFCKILGFEKEGKTSFPFTDGLNKYDFIDVKELAAQIASSSLQTAVQKEINVCSGMAVSLKDKVEEFIEKNNLKIRPEYGVFPSRKYDSPIVYGCNKKIKQIMGCK